MSGVGVMVAERARFELAETCASAVFKTAPFNHSGTSPCSILGRPEAAGNGVERGAPAAHITWGVCLGMAGLSRKESPR